MMQIECDDEVESDDEVLAAVQKKLQIDCKYCNKSTMSCDCIQCHMCACWLHEHTCAEKYGVFDDIYYICGDCIN